MSLRDRLTKSRQARKANEFRAGYNEAAGALVNGSTFPAWIRNEVSGGPKLLNSFNRGRLEACRDFEELK